MKTLVKSGFMVMLAIIAFTSCKKDTRTLSLGLNPVGTLSAPSDQADIKLAPATGASLVFQWSATQAADGDLVLYEVAFDKADGNFSKPVYKTLSDGSGVQAQATITQKDLNKIASLAGIRASSSGKIKWAIIASKATNKVVSTVSRSITIERPAGFAVLPDALFLTGTATEGGTDMTKAVPFKKTADGIFEAYTSLQAGTYQLTDKADGSGTKYYIDANGLIQQGSSTTTVSGVTKVYRLDYDFNVATTQVTEITGLGLYMSAYNSEIGQLSYIGAGTWEAAKIPVTFYQFSWGRDERYKYILHTSAGLEYWGSENLNNNNYPPSVTADYYYLLPVTNDQWNNTYKFDHGADTKAVKADVYFKAKDTYTQVITVLQ
ncbi:MAG: SusE domain-containing protein [Bacteroidota bacterium]|nr:SusE domain-containing protein [Bacteroidota bacterium]